MALQLSKTYSHNDWREDLKSIARNAGELCKPTVFLFSDSQIKDESFLVDINNLLNSGEVRGGWACTWEKGALCAVCQEKLRQRFGGSVARWGEQVASPSAVDTCYQHSTSQPPSTSQACTRG